MLATRRWHARAAQLSRPVLWQASIDVDSSGTIDYEEFLASTVSTQHLEKEETMRKAFQHFDADNSGYITRDELHASLQVLLCAPYHTLCSRLKDVLCVAVYAECTRLVFMLANVPG